MMIKINYFETDAFKKDLKKLKKRFRTLAEDLETVKKAAIELHHVHNLDNSSVFPIPGVGTEQIQIYKVKKFACRTMKGKGARSGIRMIYAYHRELSKVVLIEIYYKGDKEDEDRERIREYLKSRDE